jgi:hypothetical protein
VVVLGGGVVGVGLGDIGPGVGWTVLGLVSWLGVLELVGLLGCSGIAGDAGVDCFAESGAGLDRVDGADQGGAGSVGVADGKPGVTGCNGLPTGSEGRVLDLDGSSDRSGGVLDAPPACGTSVRCDPDGTKNQAAATATTTVASTPSFRIRGRRRLCRAPNLFTCRPSWNCLKANPFTPRSPSSLPTQANDTTRAPASVSRT